VAPPAAAPLTAAHRTAGYRYQLSILQAEFGVTQVLDRPQTGRGSFEEVMRENLDIGRPDWMQLIFNRRVTRRTPGSFRTRVLTDGVSPRSTCATSSTTMKDKPFAPKPRSTTPMTFDFEIGRALRDLPALREIGFAANRRLLRVEYLSHDCFIGDDHLDGLTHPVVVDAQRAAALRLCDRRVLALMQTLCLFARSPYSISASTRVTSAPPRRYPPPAPAAVRKRWSASMPRSQTSSRGSDLLPENLTYVLTFQSVKALSEAEPQTKEEVAPPR
jgi:hypothetical protein